VSALLLLALAGCSTSNVIATEQTSDAGEPPPGCVDVDRSAELTLPANTWVEVTPASTAFANRGWTKILYDSTRQVFLLWEGYVEEPRYPYTRYANALYTFDPASRELRLERNHHWYNGPDAGDDTVAYPENATDPTPPDRSPTHTFVFAPDLGAAFQWSGLNQSLGVAGGHPIDLWRYDVAARDWTELAPASMPATHSEDQAMIYAPSAGALVLFGAESVTGNFRETWRYDVAANAWTSSLPDPSPPPRRGGAGFEYDSRREVAVLYGGNAVAFDDVWEYSIATGTWRALAASGAGARTAHGFAYDCRHDAFLVAAGTSAADMPATIYSDTWSFSGGTWRPIETGPAGPTGSIWGDLAYSPAHDVFLALDGDETSYRFWLLRLR
jgi:hypothetical protein